MRDGKILGDYKKVRSLIAEPYRSLKHRIDEAPGVLDIYTDRHVPIKSFVYNFFEIAQRNFAMRFRVNECKCLDILRMPLPLAQVIDVTAESTFVELVRDGDSYFVQMFRGVESDCSYEDFGFLRRTADTKFRAADLADALSVMFDKLAKQNNKRGLCWIGIELPYEASVEQWLHTLCIIFQKIDKRVIGIGTCINSDAALSQQDALILGGKIIRHQPKSGDCKKRLWLRVYFSSLEAPMVDVWGEPGTVTR